MRRIDLDEVVAEQCATGAEFDIETVRGAHVERDQSVHRVAAEGSSDPAGSK